MVLFHQVSPIENILPLGQLIAWAYSSRVTPRNTLDIAYYLNNIYLFFSALYDFKKFHPHFVYIPRAKYIFSRNIFVLRY